MKQSDDPKAFFDKYGFTLTITENHPTFKDEMFFEGLEANYVSRLESELEHYKRCLMDSLSNNERLMSREFFRMKDELEKLKDRK